VVLVFTELDFSFLVLESDPDFFFLVVFSTDRFFEELPLVLRSIDYFFNIVIPPLRLSSEVERRLIVAF
jgi:hypothetical protein